MTNAEARFNKIHIRKVYACLAVTCHLHFWQNDRDFLRATVVTRGWNGYRNKSQHRKSDPGEEKFSRRSSRDSNPRPFNHESGALTTELSPPPTPCLTFFNLKYHSAARAATRPLWRIYLPFWTLEAVTQLIMAEDSFHKTMQRITSYGITMF